MPFATVTGTTVQVGDMVRELTLERIVHYGEGQKMADTLSTGSKNRPSQLTDTDWATRLGKCADDVDGYQDGLDDSIETRDKAIVQAIDAGWSGGKVAGWARVSRTRVNQILARPPAG